MKDYITVHMSHVITQSEEVANEVLATVIGAGYKRSTVSNFDGIYTKSYSSTAPQNKRVVYVRYAPEGSSHNPVIGDDVILTLLASGWCMPHHAVLIDSVIL